MSQGLGHDVRVAEVALLGREMFTVPEAARLLDMNPATLLWWLEGRSQNTKTYPPVLRPAPTGSHVVTWGEFVEAGLLRQYRRVHKVKLPELRSFIALVREKIGAAYPLAHRRPYVGNGRRLVIEAQDEVGLPPELRLIAIVEGQGVLLPAADLFLHRVEWDDDIASQWKPHHDPKSPVRMNPNVRFGRPAIGGISTSAIWEHLEDGADVDEVATAFSLRTDQVAWARAYESSLHAPPPAAEVA